MRARARTTTITAASSRLRSHPLLLALLLMALLGLSACSGAGDSVDPDAQDGGGTLDGGAATAPDPGDEAADDAVGDAGGTTATAGAGGQGRRVVTTSVDVAVQDVAAAARRVRDVAVVAGGFVSGESSVGGDRPRTEITLRVPVAGAADVLTDVAGLGAEVSRTAESADVEAQLVDLESRTATQRAGVERIRALLTQAEDLQDVLVLETELTRRQGDLEALAAQQVALADRAALATVTVVLNEPDDPEVAGTVPPFLTGLTSGWDALAWSTGVLLVVLGAVLPFALVGVLLAVAAAAVARVVRRRPRGASSEV